jgi:predicted DNA-binding WGR domain protein
VSESIEKDFLSFLEAANARGGFETDDALTALLPLMKQVLAAHETGSVAPLRGLADLRRAEGGSLMFVPEKAGPPQKNLAKIEELQSPVSRGVEVVALSRRTADIDTATVTVTDLGIGTAGDRVTKPVFLPNYETWEHVVGHHDSLTDILSLGMLLASVACSLDFTDAEDLEVFTTNRSNLFAVRDRLNPVVASLIVQMTELDRHKRAPDLAQVISLLEHYRDQPADLDFDRIRGFRESGLTGKRKLIQTHLRDRLFDISRRNRLIYFKPTLQVLNLTVASVPILLDYRNIKLEQLFVWHAEIADAIKKGAPIALGKYLRFEDAPYISGVLDKIMSEARRDRAEFGFAQLRLVLCFLRWHNLKESRQERISSPLLLLPVELTRKKGVRDSYVLDPITTEAEINPALRHHLKELYNLSLPEVVDLRETSLDQLHEMLKSQIQASEPAVTLHKLDRPRIELIRERALQRLDHYRRRMKIKSRAARKAAKPEYSYDRENFRPLGLQLFIQMVRPTPLPLREAAGAIPDVRLPHVVDPEAPVDPHAILAAEREMFALRDGSDQNPYSWDFDLCSQTLGNFNYRKMTLVRDYARLIETDMASTAFDAVFSLAPREPAEAASPEVDLADQHLIIACDATQATAIARARTGASYIIQGPPGTGKSQTITNLIADYVARGKRALFVCEKRAAIDIVYHRLRQQGLDDLCCLIHDSQSDKRAFVQNLKRTYESFLAQDNVDADAQDLKTKTVRAMKADIGSLRSFSDAMQRSYEKTGVPLRNLLHRLVEIIGHARDRKPEVEDMLPDYALWLCHAELVERLRASLEALGEDLCFARNPLRWLSKDVLEADRPLEALFTRLDQAEELLDAVETALELASLPDELRNNFGEVDAILEFAQRALPIAESNLLGALNKGPATKEFDALAAKLAKSARALRDALEKTSAWHDPLSADDTQNALAQARTFEGSLLRFLQPAFWRLKKTLRARYDFARHAVTPPLLKILTELTARHQAQKTFDAITEEARTAWHTTEVDGFRELVVDLRARLQRANPSVKALIGQPTRSDEAGQLIEQLARIREPFIQLDATLESLLAEHRQFDLGDLADLLGQLREQTGQLTELQPVLRDFATLPEPMSHALRRVPVPLDEFEGAAGDKSVSAVFRQDRSIGRFDGRALARKMEQLETHHREWLGQNSRCICAAVRRKFIEHVSISSLSASQLDARQKAFKKTYAAGRRELEHEFGKTMRYKSIRDLAADESGEVVRDLKPIWLMSPLSVSDTLPLDPSCFDVVIFDEASQIPLEEAIPAIYRSNQVIVVGDEMQLPPTAFFAGGRSEDEGVIVEEEGERFNVDLSSDSFLTQCAMSLPSTLLAWHYRSRYESLISFSNAAFYGGGLFTIPDRQRFTTAQPELRVTASDQAGANLDALLSRSISFHFIENGVYAERRNRDEAVYIAGLVRGLLERETGLSIGVVAFSEAQQSEIEDALEQLAEEDSAFAARLEAEIAREENDQFCGLFVKNLENVQGDERDVIFLSVCYGYDANRRMLMNFGPINQRGGEKRLNVIFSRAKHHMVVVSSIRHHDITNDHNDGANSLKRFLQYAEATSSGDVIQARRVLQNVNPLARKALAPTSTNDAVVAGLATALRSRGYTVDLDVGQSQFRCDLAVGSSSDSHYRLGILVDTNSHYLNPNLLDRYLMQPAILRAFGWRFALVLTKDWYQNPSDVLARLERLLERESDEDETQEHAENNVGENPPSLREGAFLRGAKGDIEFRPAPDSIDEESAGADETSKETSQDALATSPNTPSDPKSASVPSATELDVRRFELVGGSSRKFWEISVAGTSFTVRFGRLGTAGQSQTKSFADEATAKRQAESLIADKLKKGYIEKLS